MADRPKQALMLEPVDPVQRNAIFETTWAPTAWGVLAVFLIDAAILVTFDSIEYNQDAHVVDVSDESDLAALAFESFYLRGRVYDG